MVKYFLWLSRGTENSIVNDAFNCAKAIDSRRIQTITKLLKSNGFTHVLSSPLTVNENIFHKILLRRLLDIYLQELKHTDSSKLNYYMEAFHVGEGYEFQECVEKVKIPATEKC